MFSSSKCSLFHNSNLFGSVLFTFCIQDVLKFKKYIIPAQKSLISGLRRQNLKQKQAVGSYHVFATGVELPDSEYFGSDAKILMRCSVKTAVLHTVHKIKHLSVDLKFIGPCIMLIVEER